MADDLKAGRPTEIAYLNGEVVGLAKKLGRQAPVNEAIVSLVRQAEAGVELLWEPAKLRAHVLEGHQVGTDLRLLSLTRHGRPRRSAAHVPAGVPPCACSPPFPSLALALAGCAGDRRPVRPAAPAAGAPRPPARSRPSCRPTSGRSNIRSTPRPTPPNLRFTGRADIDIEVLEATDSITLNAADLDFGNVSLGGGKRVGPARPQPARHLDVDEEKQTATFRFAREIAPGRYRLTIDYNGKIYTQAAGLFALDYESAGGQEARALHPVRGARRPPLLPRLGRAAVPHALQSQRHRPRRPGRGRQHAAGGRRDQCRRHARPSPSRPLRPCRATCSSSPSASSTGSPPPPPAPRSASSPSAATARRAAGRSTGSAQVVPWFNEYFGTPYPLPKLDNVAGPGSSQFFGAMENWGAIFSFESILLVDPADHHRGDQAAHLRGRRARDRPPMVRQSRHHGLVGRSLAERGLRLVDGDQGDHRAPSRMGSRARHRLGPRSGDQPRFASPAPIRSSSGSARSSRSARPSMRSPTRRARR